MTSFPAGANLEATEVLVLQRLLAANALRGVVGQHFHEEILARRTETWHNIGRRLRPVVGDRSLPVGHASHTRPDEFTRSSEDGEDLGELLDLGVCGEQGLLVVHLGHDGAKGPDVDLETDRQCD